MQQKTIILAALAALLLLRRPAAAAPGNTAPGQEARTITTGPTRAYFDPVALAAQAANTVLSSWRTVPATRIDGASANPEGARNAVRSLDAYYGGAALAWTAGNAEAARDAVRAGDTYYSDRAAGLGSAWAIDANTGAEVY